uniref:Putative histidine kinase phosphotransfer protein n=1 Tax=Magnetococcus massalia (strain MO-1) TaxID=451514 RepID=A0A1S7LFR6_MAGMO|nr:putative histidine kinase phosphotransfer protein [Candidatus Magnetococcus massalia]
MPDPSSILLIEPDDEPLQPLLGQLAPQCPTLCRLDGVIGGEEALERLLEHRYSIILISWLASFEEEAVETVRRIRQLEQLQGRDATPIYLCAAQPVNHSLGRLVQGAVQTPLKYQAICGDEKSLLPSAAAQDEAVDLAQAMRDTGLPESSFMEVARVISSQIPSALLRLQQELEAGQFEQARESSHILKGSMANIIFPQLQPRSHSLHQAIRDGDGEAAKLLFAQLKGVFEPILQALEKRFPTLCE